MKSSKIDRIELHGAYKGKPCGKYVRYYVEYRASAYDAEGDRLCCVVFHYDAKPVILGSIDYGKEVLRRLKKLIPKRRSKRRTKG